MARTKKRIVHQRLNQINWNYGKGEIIAVTIAWSDHKTAKGIVIRKPWQCRSEKRRFRVVNHTLFFLGHRSKLDKPFEV